MSRSWYLFHLTIDLFCILLCCRYVAASAWRGEADLFWLGMTVIVSLVSGCGLGYRAGAETVPSE